MKKTLKGLWDKAEILRNNAMVEDAIKMYLEIAEISKQSEEFEYTARALHMAGVSAKESVSKPDSTKFRDAIKYFLAAEEIYKELNLNNGLGNLYRDVAITNDYAGVRIEALKYFQKSIEILEKYDNIGSLAVTYDKLGIHHYLYNDLDSAKKYIKRAMDLFKQDPINGFYQATTWLDYAKVLAKENDTKSAMEWAEQSLDWYEADHEKETYNRRRAQLYGMLSVLYDKSRQDKTAKKYATRYEKLLKHFDVGAMQVLRDELKNIFNNEK